NYVWATLPRNISQAFVLYAQHEERVMFPATRFKYDRTTTTVFTAQVPGVHSDSGWHRENNRFLGALSYAWMSAIMAREGVPIKSYDENTIAFLSLMATKPSNYKPGGITSSTDYW